MSPQGVSVTLELSPDQRRRAVIKHGGRLLIFNFAIALAIVGIARVAAPDWPMQLLHSRGRLGMAVGYTLAMEAALIGMLVGAAYTRIKVTHDRLEVINPLSRRVAYVGLLA